MAEYIPTNFATAVQRDRCRHTVRLAERHDTYSKETHAWVRDASRGGSYWVRSDFTFWFSSADTAMEFRMRWG